jgi:RHS repeat-associated protein
VKTPAQVGSRSLVYDRYGNRRIDPTPAETSPDLVGPNPVFAAANNRIVPQTGEQYQYDSAGNLTRDRDGQTYVYDAENKMVSFNGGAPQGGADYGYDGDGRRVKKVVGTVTTVFVYDASGQLIAEYSSAAPQNNGVRYLTSDHLGSPRVVTNSSGVVQARHDYHPFGEEVGLRGGRTAQNGYVADNLRQKFTAKERDVETGLDYFGARYYSSTQGRFVSPDEPIMDQLEFNPQSWNLYIFVRNNPLNLVDPTGSRAECPDCPDGPPLTPEEIEEWDWQVETGEIETVSTDTNSVPHAGLVFSGTMAIRCRDVNSQERIAMTCTRAIGFEEPGQTSSGKQAKIWEWQI